MTGLNEAFIITKEKRDELVEKDAKSDEIIRPILRGKDIKRYEYDFQNLYLINTHNGYVDENGNTILPININDYPAVKEWLDSEEWNTNPQKGNSFKRLSERTDQGITPYNLRSLAYMDDFSKPKIIYPETVQRANFSLDDEGMLVDKTCFIIVGDNLEYLQKTLSSQLFEFAYKRLFSSIELGAAGFQYNKHALVKLPVKQFDNQEVTSDCDIFSIYNLSEEEINFISSSVNPNVRSKLPSNL